MGTSGSVTVVVVGAPVGESPGVEVLAHADDPRRAPRLVSDARPQVVLAVLGRDRDAVLAVVPEVLGRAPDTPVLAVADAGDPVSGVLAAVHAGAGGYLVAPDPEVLADAVRRAAAGEAVFSPGLAEVVTEDHLGETFGMPLVLQREDGRFSARRRTPHRAASRR